MGKAYKRLLCIFLSLMLVSGSVFTMDLLQVDAGSYTILFEDKFDSYVPAFVSGSSTLYDFTALKQNGWGSRNNTSFRLCAQYAHDGALRVPTGAADVTDMVTSNTEASSNWENYAVECDVTFNATSQSVTSGDYTWAYISGRETAAANSGYSIALGAMNDGKIRYVRLCKDGKDVKSAEYDTGFEAKNYASADRIPAGTTVRVKLEFDGQSVTGYLNGTKVVSLTVGEGNVTAGYAGLHTKFAPSETNQSNGTSVGGVDVNFDNFIVSQTVKIDYPEGCYYFSDFSSAYTLQQEGWVGSGVKDSDALKLPAGGAAYLANASGASTWQDYIVEADAKIVSGTATEGYASIVARSTDTTKNGYEFRMVYSSEGTSLVLYKRGGRNNPLATYHINFEVDTYHKLTMAVCENNIMCWFDDIWVFDYVDTDQPYLEGYTGIRSPGANTNLDSVYDNYAVRTYVEPTVTYPKGYLYYNDFALAKKLQRQGWHSNGNNADGTMVITGVAFNYLTNVENSVNWTDYVVEADVMLQGEGNTSIVARSSDTSRDGYEYRLVDDGTRTYLQLYKRGVSGGRINKEIYTMNISVIPGELNHMKMVVKGSNLICYFNGVKLFDVTDPEAYLSGYTGVRSVAAATNSVYDNYVVREILDTDIVTTPTLQKPTGDIWFYDDFTGEDSFSDRGWNSDDVEVYNSAVKLSGRLVVDGIQEAKKWTDYEVEAQVYIDKAAGLLGTSTIGWASVCARTVNSNTGYEFGIITPNDAIPYLRLYNRTTKENIAVDKTVPIHEGNHKLTMACMGNVITCYLDDALIFTAQDDSAQEGYAAIRSSGYPTYYNYFVVRTVTERFASLPETDRFVSPATGDAFSGVMTVSLIVFLASAVGMAGTILFYRKKRS